MSYVAFVYAVLAENMTCRWF